MHRIWLVSCCAVALKNMLQCDQSWLIAYLASWPAMFCVVQYINVNHLGMYSVYLLMAFLLFHQFTWNWHSDLQEFHLNGTLTLFRKRYVSVCASSHTHMNANVYTCSPHFICIHANMYTLNTCNLKMPTVFV